MAHFAELDSDNNVINIVVVANDHLLDDTNVESEQKGILYLKNLLGPDRIWVQTSWNGKIRKRHAGVGYTYDPVRDAFIVPRPHNGWVLDDDAEWVPPIPYPLDDENNFYTWDDNLENWVVVDI